MGILDIFKGLRGKKSDGLRVPYKIETRFNPLRLSARRASSVDLILDITNISGEDALCSVIVAVPKGLGTDPTGLQRKKEVNVGKIGVNEKKTVTVTIYGTPMTAAQEYMVGILAYVHFRDYRHVLNSMKRTITLRAV
ncbi:MAG: hypothetical protein QXW70_01910 [Candidatus Anstonellales archaeon]